MFPIYVYMVIIFSGADIYMSSSSGMLPYPGGDELVKA
jgi:hypothetical protein